METCTTTFRNLKLKSENSGEDLTASIYSYDFHK
jgi:hypothetical protein